MASKPSTITFEDVLAYIEQNDIQSATELKNSNRRFYNWVYNKKLSHQLPFYTRRKKVYLLEIDEEYERNFKENRTKDWYDIDKILPYLERYAREENTTVEQQCYIYFLLPEWEDFKSKNPDYPF